jgi:hypothetical protein
MVQDRTKQINIRYHFSRHAVKSGKGKVFSCPTEVMLGDVLSKALCEEKFARIEKRVFIQDTPLNQSGSVEDQASATGLVLKQAQGSGSILARKS